LGLVQGQEQVKEQVKEKVKEMVKEMGLVQDKRSRRICQ
jgi:DNA-binding LacI/PurR family transcriptional regulator